MDNPQVIEGEDKPDREVDLGKRPHFVLGRVAESSDIPLVGANILPVVCPSLSICFCIHFASCPEHALC